MVYFYRILRLNIFAVFIFYFIGCAWYFICFLIEEEKKSSGDSTTRTFISYNKMGKLTKAELDNGEKEMDVYKKLIISCYFALTTLSTVGYGDYYPVSNIERIIAVLIMLGGVAFFSFIMSNFIEIISNYEKKMGAVDKSGDLHNWLILLSRFTNNQPQ